MQVLIERAGWRAACLAMGALVLACWCRSTCCCGSGRRISGWHRTATATFHGAVTAQGPTANVVDAAWAATDWTLRARGAHSPLLVAGAGLFLRAVRLVRGAGAPDEIPGGDRLQPDPGGLGAGHRQPGGHPRADHARPCVRPDRPRVGLDRRQLRFRGLLRRPAGDGPGARASRCCI